MATREDELHRTLVQFLIDTDRRDLAAVVIDGQIVLPRDFQTGEDTEFILDIPTSAYSLIAGNPAFKQALVGAAETIARGRYSGLPITLRVMLVPVEEGWQATVRDLIVNYQGSNQATISGLLAKRDRRELQTYNEASYASQSEIRIAQEFETRKLLFFPLPFAIRAETGDRYRDHREPDFLVCIEGTWGILEVSYHPDRYEKDKEKDAWWKKSGILCIEHYTAERCYQEPGRVVDEFLEILRKHRR